MIATRRADENDMRFVASSWFESYWKGSMLSTGIEFSTYRAGQNARIERLCAKSEVLVAAFKAVPDEILGYVVREGSTCHFCYVKKDYRHQGIATQLLKGITHFTHLTRPGAILARGLNIQFNPYLLENP